MAILAFSIFSLLAIFSFLFFLAFLASLEFTLMTALRFSEQDYVLFFSFLLYSLLLVVLVIEHMSSRKRKSRNGGGGTMVLSKGKGPYKRLKMSAPSQPLRGGRVSGGASGEMKFHDIDLDIGTIPSTGDVTNSINLIAQGITESTRIGRKCTIKSINWHYQLTIPEIDAGTTPAEAESIRVILYLDKQANGATAAVTDLLETAHWLSFRNLVNVGRFKVLHDKVHTLTYGGMASDEAAKISQAKVVREVAFYKAVNSPIEFNSTAGAITEIRSNNYGVIVISSKGQGGFDSKLRVRFSDN